MYDYDKEQYYSYFTTGHDNYYIMYHPEADTLVKSIKQFTKSNLAAKNNSSSNLNEIIRRAQVLKTRKSGIVGGRKRKLHKSKNTRISRKTRNPRKTRKSRKMRKPRRN